MLDFKIPQNFTLSPFFNVVTKSDQFLSFDKKKNPASVVYQLLTGFCRTQTRAFCIVGY